MSCKRPLSTDHKNGWLVQEFFIFFCHGFHEFTHRPKFPWFTYDLSLTFLLPNRNHLITIIIILVLIIDIFVIFITVITVVVIIIIIIMIADIFFKVFLIDLKMYEIVK